MTPIAPVIASTNGAASKAQPPAPKDAPAAPAPQAGQPRAADGKFAGPQPEAPPPKARIKIRDYEADEDAAYAELQRGRQASRLLTEAEKRARVADEKEKARADAIASLKEGKFEKLFAEAGLSADQERELLARYYYAKHVEPEQMSDDQKAFAREKTARETAEAKLKERETADARAADDRAAKEAETSLEAEITEAMEAGRIPKSKTAIRRIAAKLATFEARGQSPSLELVAGLVRADLGRDTGEFVASAKPEELKDLWGEATFKAHLKAMLDYGLAMIQPRVAGAQPARGIAAPTPRPQKSQNLTPQQFLDQMRGK